MYLLSILFIIYHKFMLFFFYTVYFRIEMAPKKTINILISLLFLIIYIIYLYYCVDIIGYKSIDFNFNFYNNTSILYYYSYSKLKLAAAWLLFIIIPSLKYLFLLLVSLIYINHEIVILSILGLYSLLTIRNIFLYNNYSMKSYNIEFNIVDNFCIKAITIVIISLFILIVVSIINVEHSMSFNILFILATHGFFIRVYNIIKSLYYQYKETNTLQLSNYKYNNYVSKSSVILIIFIRFIYTYFFLYHLYICCIIIVLFIVCLYIVYREEVYSNLTSQSKYILLICFILFCIIRIMYLYIQYTSVTPFDMIKWLDIIKWFDNNEIQNNSNNGGRDNNSNNQGRANFIPRRLEDLPELNIPPRNNVPLISSITSMRSSWDEISSTRGIRNSDIVNQGLNHNYTMPNQHMHLNRANIPHSFERDTLHRSSINRISHPAHPTFTGNRNSINLPLPPQNIQPVLSNNIRPELVFNATPVLAGNTSTALPVNNPTPILASNSSTALPVNNPTPILAGNSSTGLPVNNGPQLAPSSSSTSSLWLVPRTSGFIQYVEMPTAEDIEYGIRHNIPIPKWKGTYEVRFCDESDPSLWLESYTPPTPSSPVNEDWMDIREVPESRLDELVPEEDRVPSPFRRFSKYEVWDKMHSHPLKESYELTDESYLPHDRLPISTRLDVYNKFLIYDRINGNISYSGLDRSTWFVKFLMRHGTLVTDE